MADPCPGYFARRITLTHGFILVSESPDLRKPSYTNYSNPTESHNETKLPRIEVLWQKGQWSRTSIWLSHHTRSMYSPFEVLHFRSFNGISKVQILPDIRSWRYSIETTYNERVQLGARSVLLCHFTRPYVLGSSHPFDVQSNYMSWLQCRDKHSP